MNSTAHTTTVLSLLFGVLLAGCGLASQETDIAGTGEMATTPDQDARLYGEIPTGTRFDVQLQQALSTKDNEPGDRWTGVLTRDVTDGDDVLLQRGAVVSGEVTRSGTVEVDGEQRQVLALRPTHLETGGADVPIDATVVRAVASKHKDLFTGENAAIVGGSAVAGTILGDLLLDDAALGAVLGAAGGTAVAVARSDTEIELSEGSTLTLELQKTVEPERLSSLDRRGG